MTLTHAITDNGQISMDLLEELRPAREVIDGSLAALDSVNDYAFCLWRLPDGKRAVDVALTGWPWSYIQSAGSAEAMTVEIRVSEGMDSVAEQFVVGRPVDDQAAEDFVSIPWDGNTEVVFANEVFDAQEAGDIYWYYYQYDTVPEGYSLRQITV